MSQIRALLLLGSAVALAACQGASDVASPGSGVIVVPPTTGTPKPPVTDPDIDPPVPGETPAECPTGTTNVGVITAGGGTELRNCEISGVLESDLALPNIDKLVYSLRGGVRVGRDVGAAGTLPGGKSVTLTIDPGVVLFGSLGSDFLLVERGSRLMAAGTATRPIVMTSRQNLEGTSTESSIGQWGGLVILGRAPISRCSASTAVGGTAECENRVEGADGNYGGALANDSSGVMRYLQIRYPGYEVTTGNELNGITMAGVGKNTVFENIQVVNSSDDGIEWFGGTVNGKHLILTGIDDDSLDTDFGYVGANQFVLVTQRPHTSSSNHMIEADTSGQDGLRPRSKPSFANFTFVGRNTHGSNGSAGVMFRGGTDYNMVNGIITASQPCVEMREASTIAAPNTATQKLGPPNFRSVQLECAAGSSLGSSGVTAEQVTNILQTLPTGTAAWGGESRGNQLVGANSITSSFYRGTGVTLAAFSASTVNAYFTDAGYVGAFRDTADTWYAGWACASTLAGFAPSGLKACTAAPLPIQP